MKTRIQLIAATVLAAFLTACSAPVAQPPAERRAAFDPAEYAPYAHKGTARIVGSAFLKTRGGDVKPGAGSIVFLNPVTQYSTEFVNRAIRAGERLEPPDPRATDFLWKTTGDAGGSFEFSEVAAGDYYVYCEILWEYPGGYRGAMIQTGGIALRKIHVDDGETVRLVLTE